MALVRRESKERDFNTTTSRRSAQILGAMDMTSDLTIRSIRRGGQCDHVNIVPFTCLFGVSLPVACFTSFIRQSIPSLQTGSAGFRPR